MSLFRFFKDRRGGVAPMFALAIIPVFGLIGAAVDYSRANSVRTGMQSAIDATALAMAKLAPTLTQTQLQQQATAYFNAMFNHPEALNLVITPTYTTAGGSQLVISVSGTVNTSFMRIMGFSSLNVGSTSTVKWGNSRLRVALVLDNTGSMFEYNKIGALKTATNDLLTQLRNAATNSADVYVSIIPAPPGSTGATGTRTMAPARKATTPPPPRPRVPAWPRTATRVGRPRATVPGTAVSQTAAGRARRQARTTTPMRMRRTPASHRCSRRSSTAPVRRRCCH